MEVEYFNIFTLGTFYINIVLLTVSHEVLIGHSIRLGPDVCMCVCHEMCHQLFLWDGLMDFAEIQNAEGDYYVVDARSLRIFKSSLLKEI